MSEANSSDLRSPVFLRIALGIVYLQFGLLKFFPDLSPAEMLASQTVMRLSWSWLDARTAMLALAIGECAIGLAFLFNIAPRWLPFVFFGHMLGTCSPLFILPELTFKIAPFAPTLEGQYIIKNLVFIAAAWTVLVPRWSWSADRLVAWCKRQRISLGGGEPAAQLANVNSLVSPPQLNEMRKLRPVSTARRDAVSERAR